ncbi:MAG: TraR/DksA family transcriptional regulator [Spirochaetes bacterium]|nr:TraR/DksA family transcriptional regulator [Spirochaetota bacterium]
MNQKSLKKFKDVLVKEKQEVMEELLQENESYNSLKEQEEVDILDVAFQAYEKQLLVGLSQNEKNRLERINAALKRIQEGTYGQCADCGCDIEENRLDAIPHALRCVKCSAKQEEEKKKLKTTEQ